MGLDYYPQKYKNQYNSKENMQYSYISLQQKEIQNLLSYQSIEKEEKLKNEYRLQRLFERQKSIDLTKQMKQQQLQELKVNRDQQYLFKQKEQTAMDALDASWCFYQHYSPRGDQKPIMVEQKRRRVLSYLEKQLAVTTNPEERAEIKKKINKFQSSEDSYHKLQSIEQKVQQAKLKRYHNLDKSIEHIRQHDHYILDKSIERIEEPLPRNEYLMMHRNIVKSNSEMIAQQKKMINQHLVEEKNLKIAQIEEQKHNLLRDRQQILESLNNQKKQVKGRMEHERYPLLNSLNYGV